MRVSVQDVEKIASLAKLAVTNEQKIRYHAQLEQILDYVETLKELDTQGVEPTIFVLHPAGTMREDLRTESLPVETALANAPAQSLGFFRVPKVVTRPDGGP